MQVATFRNCRFSLSLTPPLLLHELYLPHCDVELCAIGLFSCHVCCIQRTGSSNHVGEQPVRPSTEQEDRNLGLHKRVCLCNEHGGPPLLSIPCPPHVRAPRTQIIFHFFQSRLFDLHNNWTDLSSAQVYTTANPTTRSTILSKFGPKDMLLRPT